MNQSKAPELRRGRAVTIRLRPGEFAVFARAAEDDKRSLSDMARRLIEASLKHRDQEPVALAQQHAS